MNLKHCGKMGIRHLDASDKVVREEAKPHPIDLLTLREEPHGLFNGLNVRAGLLDGEAKTVLIERACAYVPKFTQILRGETELGVAILQRAHSFSDQAVLRMTWVRKTQKHIRIYGV